MASVGDTLVNCTGTGTSTDPYIFKNWEGFRECIVVSSAYCEYDSTVPENERIINLNDESPNGVSAIVFTCTSVNGNGCSIINANITSYAGESWKTCAMFTETGCSIKNINFLNLILRYQHLIGSSALMTFTNCQFSVLFLNPTGMDFTSADSAYAKFDRCGITIKTSDNSESSCNTVFRSSGSSSSSGVYADKCIIDLRVTTLNPDTQGYIYVGAQGYYSYRVFLSNIKVIGRVPNNVSLVMGIYNSTHVTYNNIVVDCEAGYVSPWSGDTCGLINTSKIANPSADSDYTAKNIHPVTSEELVNVAFLDSLGFPILKADV